MAHGCLGGESEIPVVQNNTAGMEAVPEQRDLRRVKRKRYIS
jgi:hypothetical protein